MTGGGFRATYRLQLGPGLTFAGARGLVPYLADLGVSHLYLSPVLQARVGSTHGYDVVDPKRVSDVLGGEQELRALAAAARAAGLGIVLDVVPNHMATSEEENRYWRDPELRARFFDWDAQSGWYRRFFDVGDLGGVRIEDEEVFAETHAKILQLVRDGVVDGLRVDHPDGLADPRGYLERLRDAGARHVWVEKILEPGERLRDWPVEGTTGYEFANDSTALFVDARAEPVFTALYGELTGETREFAAVAEQAKLEQAETTFAAEVERLRALHATPLLERALASFHVYRTYVEPWSGRVEADDHQAVRDASVTDALARVLLLSEPGHDEFVTRFQQTTGAVMAKGVEDTAFYRYFRLTALNEVGGDPGRFGIPVEQFHRANAERLERFPLHLLTTQTHDTKRSGDVRARITALTWIAEEWAERRRRWRALEDPHEDELLWQTLVGAWPLPAERLEAYLEKALREGKRTTNWLEPDVEHERRVKEAARGVVGSPPPGFVELAARVDEIGHRISLATTLLKLTAPGIADLYQGDEIETLNLVDPDNRRSVDWELRRRLLADVRAGEPPRRETAKLHLIVRALDVRRRRPEAFAVDYAPIRVGDSICAFRRGDDVAVAVPVRGDTEVPPDLLDDGWVDLLPELPVSLYERA